MSSSQRRDNQHPFDRRTLLVGLATAPLASCAAPRVRANAAVAPASAATATTSATMAAGPFAAEGMAAYSQTGRLKPLQFQRRALGPNDVTIRLHYCGVCHSDIHTVRGD